MIFSSGLITRGSGSFGGLTFSHNRGGNYIRARTIPVNPSTSFQNFVRSVVSDLSNLWTNTLTEADRVKWDLYGTNVPITNALGESIFLTGLNHYVRSNVGRAQAGLARQDVAPGTFNLGSFTALDPVAQVLSVAVGDLILTFDDTDAWVSEDLSSMLVYISEGKGAAINYYTGPYRFADSIDGEVAIPPTSPATVTVPFTYVAGQKAFFYVRVTRADGRLSNLQRVPVTVIA